MLLKFLRLAPNPSTAEAAEEVPNPGASDVAPPALTPRLLSRSELGDSLHRILSFRILLDNFLRDAISMPSQ